MEQTIFKIKIIHLMISAGSKNESTLCRSNFLEGELDLWHYISFISKELWVYAEEKTRGYFATRETDEQW